MQTNMNKKFYTEEIIMGALLGKPIGTLTGLVGKTQRPEYHPEGDAWNHSVKALKYVTKELCGNDNTVLNGHQRELQMAMLYHDIGKVETPDEELPRHFNHDIKGYRMIEEGRVPEIPELWRKPISLFCKHHMKKEVVKQKKKDSIMKELLEFFTIDDIILLMKADTINGKDTGGNRWMEFYELPDEKNDGFEFYKVFKEGDEW